MAAAPMPNWPRMAGDVDEVADEVAMLEARGHDDGVSGEDGGALDVAVLAGVDGAIGAEDEGAFGIGLAVGAAGAAEVHALLSGRTGRRRRWRCRPGPRR